MASFLSRFLTCAALLALAACSSSGPSAPPSAVKVGKPYTVGGKTYYPQPDLEYDEVGIASWYGPGFHGKYTANGERFNKKDLTAAHPTLPMPSMVRVTDMMTGRSIIARVNDRGPFSSDRIIDLSEAAASELGIKGRGLAQVRVQFLPKETAEYLASISQPGKPIEYPGLNVASNASATQPVDEGAAWESQQASAAPAPSVDSIDLPAPTNQRAPMQNLTAKFNPIRNAEAAETTAPAAGGYYIQAGAFSIEENALKLMNKLSGIGKVSVARQENGERTWFRVRLGPLATHEEAEDALRQVATSGVPDAKIIQ